MFFQSINDMMGEGDTLVVIVNKSNAGTLNLTITPKGTFKHANLGTGLSVEETPQQLDADLGANLSRYTVARRSLQEQIEAAAVVLDSASKAVVADAVKRMATKPGADAKPNTSDTKVPTAGTATLQGANTSDRDGGLNLF